MITDLALILTCESYPNRINDSQVLQIKIRELLVLLCPCLLLILSISLAAISLTLKEFFSGDRTISESTEIASKERVLRLFWSFDLLLPDILTPLRRL